MLSNTASARVRTAIREYRNLVWSNFLKEIGPNFVSSRPAWQKINTLRSNVSGKKFLVYTKLMGLRLPETKKKPRFLEKF